MDVMVHQCQTDGCVRRATHEFLAPPDTPDPEYYCSQHIPGVLKAHEELPFHIPYEVIDHTMLDA